MWLPRNPADWPQPWLDAYQERVCIMDESNVTDVERKAEADVRKCAARS